MGTRNFTIIRNDGKIIIRKYSQWDGYLSAAGRGFFELFHNVMNGPGIQALKNAVLKNLQVLSAEEASKVWMDAGHDGSEWITLEVGDKVQNENPLFGRDARGDEMLLTAYEHEGDAPLLIQMWDPDIVTIDQAGKCWCDYAYDIDFDDMTLMIWPLAVKIPFSDLAANVPADMQAVLEAFENAVYTEEDDDNCDEEDDDYFNERQHAFEDVLDVDVQTKAELLRAVREKWGVENYVK